jgi:hypothetical protein
MAMSHVVLPSRLKLQVQSVRIRVVHALGLFAGRQTGGGS